MGHDVLGVREMIAQGLQLAQHLLGRTPGLETEIFKCRFVLKQDLHFIGQLQAVEQFAIQPPALAFSVQCGGFLQPCFRDERLPAAVGPAPADLRPPPADRFHHP